jgi:hypothetical protein
VVLFDCVDTYVDYVLIILDSYWSHIKQTKAFVSKVTISEKAQVASNSVANIFHPKHQLKKSVQDPGKKCFALTRFLG